MSAIVVTDVALTPIDSATPVRHSFATVFAAAQFFLKGTRGEFLEIKGRLYKTSLILNQIEMNKWPVSGTGDTLSLLTIIQQAFFGNLRGGFLQYNGYNYVLATAIAHPVLTASGVALAFGNVANGGNSTLTYTIAGKGLKTDALTLTLTGSRYTFGTSVPGLGTAPVVLVPDEHGDVATTTIYVKFSPNAVASFDGSIANTASNATTRTITLTGAGI